MTHTWTSYRLALFVSVIALLVSKSTSQTGANVTPGGVAPSNTTNNGNGINDISVKPTATKNGVKPSPKTNGKSSDCWLAAHPGFRDHLSLLLNTRNAKLVEFTVHLIGNPDELLGETLVHVYRPHHWVRSTSRQGRSLLMLDDTYGPMSLSTLSIGVEMMKVNVTDNPPFCLRNRSEAFLLRVLRESFLRDFADPHQTEKASLSEDEHVCNQHILDEDGYASFVYRCCRFDAFGKIICEDVREDNWIKTLLTLITLIKVMVVLFSPSLIPSKLYRLKYVAAQYLYRPEKPLKLKVVVTQEPHNFGDNSQKKRVRLNDLKNMEVFKTMVASSRWQHETIYEVLVKDIRLSVKARKLMKQAAVPVTMKSIIYNNLIRCRIRKLEPLTECCKTNLLGRFNPGYKLPKWEHCMKIFAGMVLAFVFALPWIFRVYGYFSFEQEVIERKEEAAESLGLSLRYPGSIVMYLSPLHAVFVLIYLIFIIDSLVYGVISTAMKEKFKHVVRQCLRDMRERSRIAIFAWLTKLLVLPFTMCGVVGFLVFPIYLIVVAIVGLPVAAFYIFPTLNLSIRLIINLFIFMCPSRWLAKLKRTFEKFTSFGDRFNMKEVTANENFVKRHEYSKNGIALQLVIIIMVLISFWSITMMMMEIASFFVELLVFTFMGIIVNAGSILQYVTVLFLLFMYSKNCFATVSRTFQSYHKVIHSELLKLKREEIDEVARQDAAFQQNTAFVVQGDKATNMQKDVTPRIKVKDGQPQWSTKGMLVFLDKNDTPYTPEKFFFETIDLNYFGCPGPIYRNVFAASWEFIKIVLFLLFIFIVVMAFGDAYQVSTTNQLLATVVGGFVPFLFRYIFVSDSGVSPVDTSSVQFTTEFHKTINEFAQSWGVFDIIPMHYKEWDGKDDVEEDDTIIDDASNLDGNGNNTDMAQPGGPRDNGGVDPNLSAVPLLHDTSASGVEISLGEEAASRGGGSSKPASTTVGMDYGYPEVDIIIDVSSAKTRRANALTPKGFEKGSVSMLDRTARDSARIYKPNERAIDVP